MSESVAGQQPAVEVTYEHDGQAVGTMTMPYWDPDRELNEIDLGGSTYQQLTACVQPDGSVTVEVEPV